MIRKNKNGENEIALINIFESINGEGYASGKPVVFIRCFKCNLRCGFCFGKNQNGRYPYVLNKYGQLISLDLVKIGDEILTMDPLTNNSKVTTVTNIISHESNNIRSVDFGLSGYNHFNVTGEHPFYIDKWEAIENIPINSLVKRNISANITKYVIENILYSDLVKYSQDKLNEIIKLHQDNINWADKNGQWNGKENERNFMLLKRATKEICNDYPFLNYFKLKNSTLEVHHLDGDHKNDNITNLVIIPCNIHNQLHARGNNFKKNFNPYEIKLTKNEIRRKNLKYGNTVINIETSDHSYYVQDSEKGCPILVHNCDTKECWSEENLLKVYPERNNWTDPYKWMTAKEIFKMVDKMEENYFHKSICLTGGEPLHLENKEFMLNELLPLFVNANYDVGIETDGAIDYTPYKNKFGDSKIINANGDREGITIIADYKLPHSGMTKFMNKDNFKLYSEMDLIKMVISDDAEDWQELNNVLNSATKASIYLSPCFGEVTMSRIPEYVIKHADKPIRAQIQAHKIFWEPTKKDV